MTEGESPRRAGPEESGFRKAQGFALLNRGRTALVKMQVCHTFQVCIFTLCAPGVLNGEFIKRTAPSLQRGGTRVSTEKFFGEAKWYLQQLLRFLIRGGSPFPGQKEIFCLAGPYPNPGLSRLH